LRYLRGRSLVFYIDLLNLLVGHVKSEAIVLAAELQTAIDDGHMINIGEKPGFMSAIVITAFCENDGDAVSCPREEFAALSGSLKRRAYCRGLSSQRLHTYFP
jgi:hypothetical protein